MEPIKCCISEVVDSENKAVLVSFPSGELVQKEAHKLKCEIYKEKNTGKRLVAVSTEDCVFSGSEPNTDKDIVHNLLAIRNKKTNKVKLVPVQNYNLTPAWPEVKNEIVSEVSQISHVQLGMKFGSKRKQRSLEQNARMRADAEIMEEKLKKMSETVTVDSSALEKQDDANTPVYLPPSNRDANTVEEIYKLTDLLTSNELEILKAEAMQILTHAEKYKKEDFTEFFWQNLTNVSETDKDKVLDCVTILVYAELITKFLQNNSKHVATKSYSSCSFSQEIHKKIMNDFTVQSAGGRTRPLSMRDKGICYIIVLGLLAGNFALDLQPLSQCINLPVKRLIYYGSLLGTVNLPKGSSTIVLKLPLPPMPTEAYQGKKRSSSK